MSKCPLHRSVEEIIIIACAMIMTVTLTPFAIYRYSNEQYAVALLEIISVGVICGIGIYVWKTRKTKVMTIVTSAFMLIVLVAFNYMLNTSVLIWIYPTIMVVYFINSLKISAVLVTPAMLALMPLLIKERPTVEVISIVVTLIICQLFGYLLSRKIQQQYYRLEQLVNQDGLTGALNRRAFDERTDFLHNFSIRHNKKEEAIASLILFDIDNFKAINDEYGHQEGDKILIELTRIVKKNIRGIDQLYRYGGEEFVVIANGADAFKATELAEKIRLTIESSHISELTRVTASFGIAELHNLEPAKRWVERADQAMYRAKRAGRNRAFIANYNDINIEDTTLNLASV